MPRLEKFKSTATFLDVKKQIAKKYEMFMGNEKGLETDEDINDNITIQIEDNCPFIKKGYGRVRASSEFSGKKHGQNDLLCAPKVDGKNANNFQHCQEITV
jgi:hypothetical protein